MANPIPVKSPSVPLIVAAVIGVVAIMATYLVSRHDPEKCILLVVNSSTEKDGLIDQLADRYNEAGRTVGGRCARVEVDGLTSGVAMESLAAGWKQADGSEPRDAKGKILSKPHVWMPTSSLWLGLFEQKRTGDIALDEAPQPIVKSPLVVAVFQPMAETLGWWNKENDEQNKELGWSNVLNPATDPGWGSRGHPEWGDFRFGKDDPHSSTSGLAATIMTYYAATGGKLSNTTDDPFKNVDVISYVHGVESSPAYKEIDSVEYLKRLYKEDQESQGNTPPSISAFVLQEQMAFDYNTGRYAEGDNPGPPPHRPLVAVYPKDGALMLDHPYVVLSTADKDEKAAAADFRAFLQEPEQQKDFIKRGFRDDDKQPSEAFLRTLGNRYGQNLSRIDQPAPDLVSKILASWDATHRKARVLLVLDLSGSMREPADSSKSKLELLKPAALQGLERLDDDDEVGLWTFSDSFAERVRLSQVSDVRDHISEVINGLRDDDADGDTALYFTIRAARQKMLDGFDKDGINAVVLLTDGNNHPEDKNDRNALLNSLGAASQDKSVPIFTIPYGPNADVDTLREVALETNAISQEEGINPLDINKAFVKLFTKIRTR